MKEWMNEINQKLKQDIHGPADDNSNPDKHLGCLFRLFKKGNLFDGN